MNNIGGLLAHGNPMMDIGMGLLSASGPSAQPVSFGQAIGQAGQFASQRDQARMQNEFMRDRLRQQQEQQRAQTKLQGLLTSPELETPQGQQEMLGLLAQVAPDQVAGGLLGQYFPQADRAEPAGIREFRTLYPDLDPGTPEGREAYFAYQKQINPGADLDQLVTMTTLELNRMKMDQERTRAENERMTRDQQRRGAQLDINKNLKYIEEAAMLNDKLAPTFLAAGNLGVDLRAKAKLAMTEVKEMVTGIRDDEAMQVIEDFNRYKKLTSELIIQGMGRVAGEGMGTATNQRMQLLSDSMAGVGNTPGSNKLIFADTMEGLLDVAEIEGLSVSDQSKYRELLNTLRSPTSNIPTGSSMPLPQGVQSIRRID